ncbi:MAG TPA: MarR family transcriptional regulator [Acidimicrobiales bacterium]|nr:MarR family transcriptional regulator [Acidimicrobiales bacterium]
MAKAHRMDFDAIAEARRQWESRGWDNPAAMAATTAIMRAQQIILAHADEALRPLDLTFARYEALVLLAFSRQGALPLGKMGVRLMLHPTSVTNIVDRLEKQGLVDRDAHPTDRRTTLARITDEGRRLVAKATEAVSATGFGLAGLHDGELDQITDLLRKVRVAVGDFPG